MRKWLSLLLALAFALSCLVAPGTAVGARQFTVVFKADTLPADASEIVAAAGGQVVAAIPEIGVMVISGSASVIPALSAPSAVQVVGPTLTVKLAPVQMVEAAEETDAAGVTPDLYNLYQWDIKQVTNNGASWTLSRGSHNTVVAVLDTGISTAHPALRANLLGGRNFVPDGPGGTVVPDDIEDRHGHGSHCAGAIAGNGRILGIGPDLGLRAYRVLGANGSGSSAGILQAIVAATNDGVNVISMSLSGFYGIGMYTWTDPETGAVYRFHDVADFVAYKRAVEYAVKNGVVVVAAAGNDSTDIANPKAISELLNSEYGAYGYNFQGASQILPAKLPGVVTVSATGPDMSPSSYTNYGSGAIDVSAPGGDFQRYPIGDWYTDMCLSAYRGTGYSWMAGTSMATPKVAGAAAVIIDQAKTSGQKLTVSQVIAKLQQSATDLGKPGYDMWYGQGMVNAYQALGGR